MTEPTSKAQKVTPEVLADSLVQVISNQFNVILVTRDQRQSSKVTKAAIMLLEQDIVNSTGDNFDQVKFKEITKTFFGDDEEIKLKPEMVAQTLALLYPEVPTRPQAAIKYLVDFYDSQTNSNQSQNDGQAVQAQGGDSKDNNYMANIIALTGQSPKTNSAEENLDALPTN